MREDSSQLPLTAPWLDHPHATESAAMSALLDEQPALAALVQQDLDAACPTNPHTGARPPGGAGAAHPCRATAHGVDLRRAGVSPRGFRDVPHVLSARRADGAPSKPALRDTLRQITPATLAMMNDRLVTSGPARAVEPARTVRMDATVVPVAIHHPTDSSLLADGVRVLDRLLRSAERDAGFTAYHRHRRRAKRRAMEVEHLAPQATTRRRGCYRDLLRLTEATVSYATCVLAHLEALPPTPKRDRLRAHLTTMLPRVARVIDQTTRRVLEGEAVPADEKLVSLFKAHADVLVKDRRATYCGHKIYLTTGRFGLILDCAIPKGNPRARSRGPYPWCAASGGSSADRRAR